MSRFDGKKGKRTRVIAAIVVIVLIAAMLITALVGALTAPV